MRFAAVLDHVVQEAGDGLVLAAAELDDQAGDAEQVVEVRDVGALAHLRGMGDAGVVDCSGEAFSKYGHAAPCHSEGTIMPDAVAGR